MGGPFLENSFLDRCWLGVVALGERARKRRTRRREWHGLACQRWKVYASREPWRPARVPLTVLGVSKATSTGHFAALAIASAGGS